MAEKKKKVTPIGRLSTSASDNKAAKRLSASKAAGAAERKTRKEKGQTKSGAPSKRGSAPPRTPKPPKKAAAAAGGDDEGTRGRRGRPAGSGGESATLTDKQAGALEKRGAAVGRKDAAERAVTAKIEAEPTGSEAATAWEAGAESRLGLETPRGATLIRPRKLTDAEKSERQRSADMSRSNRRRVTRQDLKAGTSSIAKDEITDAVDNDIPASVRQKRDYPSFPVTPGQAKKRREYLFGEGTDPIVDDIAPVTGVDLTDAGTIKVAGKFLPGNEIDVKTLARMDTPIKKAADEAAEAGEVAKALAELAGRIPKSVPDDSKKPAEVFTSDTSTSAGVETGPQPTRSGSLADVISNPAPEGGKSSRELLGTAVRFMGRGGGRGVNREVSGALTGGQFSTPGVVVAGRSVAKPVDEVVGGPKLVPQDVPELEAFAARMAEEAPNMPREYDLLAEGPPAVRGGVTTGGGLVSGEGYPLREIRPEQSPGLEAQALENKRTTPINSVPGEVTPIDTDIDVPESGGTRTEQYRSALGKLNEKLASSPELATASRPALQSMVDAAMGRLPSRKGRVTTTFPRPFSRNNPENAGMPRTANREGLGVMSSPQTQKFMKAIRRDVGIKAEDTDDEGIRLTQENAGVTREIERELMGNVLGVGEGKDKRGAQIGTRTGQEIAEAGGNPNEDYGQIMLGGSPVSGGPKSMTAKVKLKGQEKEGDFVTSQPNIPDVTPTRKNAAGEQEPIPGVVTLPELKVIDPHRGSVFDYVSGAGKAVAGVPRMDASSFPSGPGLTLNQARDTLAGLRNRTAGEKRPDIPGTVSFEKSIGGKKAVFSTLLSTVKPSGTRLVQGTTGSSFDTSGTYINPEKGPKQYDVGYDKVPTSPVISPETTPGTIVAGAGSLFRPRGGGADIVGTVSGAGTVGTSIPGVAISRGNPIVTDAAAAARNPAIQRAAMRPYREGGIARAKEQSRALDLHMRGQQMAAATARLTDAERSMRAAQVTAGAAASVGGTLIKPGEHVNVPKLAVETPMTTSQVSLRSRAGLPTTGRPGKSGVSIMDSAVEMANSLGALEQSEKQEDPFGTSARSRQSAAAAAQRTAAEVADYKARLREQ